MLLNLPHQTLRERETIDLPQRLRDVARTLVHNRSAGLLRCEQGYAARVRAMARTSEPDGIGWEVSGPWPQPPFVCEVVGYNSVFQVPAGKAVSRDGLLVTPLPAQIVRLRRRQLRRAPAPAGWALLVRHPGRPGLSRPQAVRDVSHGGLSFWTDLPSLLSPGLSSLSLELVREGHEPIRLGGEVRFVAGEPLGSRAVCGVRAVFRSTAEQTRWREVVAPLLYPRTQTGSGWSEACWELYDRTGYFALSDKAAACFAPRKQAYLRTSQQLQASPGAGCHVVWPRGDGTLQAALSVLKVYHHSWLGYQMAKIRGDAPDGVPSGHVLRDIHRHAYEHAQHDPELRWLIGYCQHKPVWSRLAHHDFTLRYAPSERACVVPFRALEVPCAGPALPRPEELEVSAATPAEIDLLLGTLARMRPQPYREALDLVPSRFDLAGIRAAWARANLARDRAVLVARRGGVPLAAAVLETAEDGLHLFQLFDLVRVYPLAPGGVDCLSALLQQARGWYRRKGKETFVCFLEEGMAPAAGIPHGVGDLGGADMCILSADLLPDLLEHVDEVTVPRERT
jgi:hypothetical protein